MSPRYESLYLTIAMNRLKQCLVSACLTGLCTRYDGQSKADQGCLRLLAGYRWIPVCPEQLGGLPTPRPAARLTGGDGFGVLAGTARVIDKEGVDRTESFLRGATMVLAIAQAQHIDRCFLKSRSPSCGLGPPIGVTAALLWQHGIEVVPF
jgi:uncharacterized protein YbbK (DUF523 family)